jgi:hypothetical protein
MDRNPKTLSFNPELHNSTKEDDPGNRGSLIHGLPSLG